MTLREFLDSILEFIGSESLTDDEWDTITLPAVNTLSKEMYEALKAVLLTREDVSGQGKKLKLYFISAGVDLSAAPPVHVPNSNILFGGSIF